jgi:hypothetical protein
MDPLLPVVRNSISTPVGDDAQFLADAIRQRLPRALALLVYGSTLRGAPARDTLIDFYVLVDRLGDGVSKAAAIAGWLVPPNVYYIELNRGSDTLRAKYAVVTMAVLEQRVQRSESNPYFWVRFAQPMSLAYCRDEGIKIKVLDCVTTAIRTAYGFGLPVAQGGKGIDVWRALFAKTYRTELRPERAGRPASIVDLHKDYFRRVSTFLDGVEPRRAFWPWIVTKGKALTIVRLAKAAYTFSGGVDYVAWKIERHTGQKLALSDWQRKHPLIAGLLMLPKLLRQGLLR